MKKKLFTLLIMFLLLLAGCSLSFDGTTGEVVSKLTRLSSPEVKGVKDNVVYWNSVSNADAYIININDIIEHRTTDLSFPLESVINENMTIYIKIKAKGNGITFSDSEWSSIYTFEFVKEKVEYEKTKLNTPLLSGYSNNVITWSGVANASAYVVKINEKEEVVWSTFYNVVFEESQEFTIQVKAMASLNDMYYLDSDWSNIHKFQYVNQNDNSNSKDNLLRIEEYCLGSGVNALTGVYLDLSDSNTYKFHSFFDKEKLANYCDIEENNLNKTEVETYSENTAEEFVLSIASKYLRGSNAGIGDKNDAFGFTATFSQKFKISGEFNWKETTKEYYQLSTQFHNGKRIKITIDEENGMNLITDKAKKDLDKLMITPEENLREEIINFFKKYGTHIIVDGIYGGKVEVLYATMTNSTNWDANAAVEYKKTIETEIKALGTQANKDISNEIDAKLNIGKDDSETKTIFKFMATGGQGLTCYSFEGLEEAYKKWVEGYNDSEKNTLVGTTDDGLTAIWNFIPNEYNSIAEEMKKVYLSETIKINNNFLEQIKPVYVSNTVDFAGGDGSSANPFLIMNETQLKNIANYIGENYCFKLINNITLSDSNWTPIGFNGAVYNAFKGRFDGDGYRIIGLKNNNEFSSSNDINYYGLFAKCDSAIIENVILDSVKINMEFSDNSTASKTYIYGGIVGECQNTIIKNCSVSGNIIIGTDSKINGNSYVGGIVGRPYQSRILYCSNKSDILSKIINVCSVGGIVGYIDSPQNDNETINCIMGCYSIGELESYSKFGIGAAGGWAATGGILGSASIGNNHSVVKIKNNFVYTTLIKAESGVYNYAGAIVGRTQNKKSEEYIISNFYLSEVGLGPVREGLNNIVGSNIGLSREEFSCNENSNFKIYSENAFVQDSEACWLYIENAEYPILYWENK